MKSKFVINDHPTILIDGIPLDILLNEIYPDGFLLGLIPTITDWFSMEDERRLVEQVYDMNEEVKIIPVLMCPDDCDLSCTLIVVEVETSNELVNWKRMGRDMNNPRELIEKNMFLESGVEWLDKVPPMIFSKEDYRCIEKIYKYKELE
ncbi:hypothetical protein [Paenibacillus kobensis]|uniref:hypothetical protein n=1 Tax=Paenibacillus kobensis TaxID=59841 RepID=UPI000FDA094B|nr:hypothetical protein [Paenibacillus kobensis]